MLLLACGCGGSDIRRLTILHTNDLHARLLPDGRGRGGFAHVAAAIREERAAAPEHTLVVHGGDFVQGTPVSTLFRGMPAIEVANLMGFDVHTLGNHEFDYGWERTREFIEAGEFATVSANVVNDSGDTLADPYVVVERAGMRIGVIGIVTEQLANLTRAELRGPWRSAPIVETVRRYAAELKDKTDLVIVLAHNFNDEDDDILAGVPEVPILISGHNHGGQEDVKEVDGRVCVKVRAYGRELGKLDVEYDVRKRKLLSYDWRRIDVTTDVHPAVPEVAKLVDDWEAKVAAQVDLPIGRSTANLDKRELLPLIERIMREAVSADLAYMNPGGVRDGIAKGEILKRGIWNMLPFGNVIQYGEVRGRDLPKEVRDRPGISPNSLYVVATNNFIAEKWSEKGVSLKRRGPVLREAVISWIEDAETIP